MGNNRRELSPSRDPRINSPEIATAELGKLFTVNDYIVARMMDGQRPSGVDFKVWDHVPANFDQLSIVTQEPMVNNLFPDLAEGANAPLNLVILPEEDNLYYAQEIRREGWPPRLVAENTASLMATDQALVGYPAIALARTVSNDNGQVLRKPVNSEQAIAMIAELSDKYVNFDVGLGMLVPTQRRSSWASFTERAAIRLKLKNLSRNEIDTYLTEVGDDVLLTPGAIDYSTSAGKRLLDPSRSVFLSAGNSAHGTIFGTNRLSFGSQALSSLDTYFQGTPREQIKGMIRIVPAARNISR